jgi:putative alpha-1,2-mannosidase
MQNQTVLPNSPLILVDLTDLPDSRINGSIEVDGTTGRIVGNGTFNPSFGLGTYDLHFCADFSGAAIRDTGVFMNNRAGSEPKSLRITPNGNSPPIPAGAWAQFQAPANAQILVRVGLSFIGVEQACHNAETEIPDFGFDKVLAAAEDVWRQKLSVISVDATGVSDMLQTVFWSGAYRAMISPQDYTGENPLWQSDEPYYDSYYCIWDSFRSIHPLLTVLDPESQTRMIRTLIDVYRHEGKLPDCRKCASLSQIFLFEMFCKMFVLFRCPEEDTTLKALFQFPNFPTRAMLIPILSRHVSLQGFYTGRIECGCGFGGFLPEKYHGWC